jgi:hypothetical protein
MLGVAYLAGESHEMDPVCALVWLTLAADAGEAEAAGLISPAKVG